MYLHKELQQQNAKTKQFWPEHLLGIRVLLILDICNQSMQNCPFQPRFSIRETQGGSTGRYKNISSDTGVGFTAQGHA